jgi:hypothetical protein
MRHALLGLAALFFTSIGCTTSVPIDAADPSDGAGRVECACRDGGLYDLGQRDARTVDTSLTDSAAESDATTSTDAASTTDAGGLPSGWLYTQGNHLYVSNGAGGTPWMGRGVNIDDIFLCEYNYQLWMTTSDATTALHTIVDTLATDWHATFLRISLSMATDPTHTDWVNNPTQYRDPMTDVVHHVGTHVGVYVLVTLRSHASMILQDQTDGDPEATGIPSDSTSTPDATMFPHGTDDQYVALVDTFAHDPYVLFGITNEPGGNKRTNDVIRAAMEHAVSVIRAEEDHLGVSHHIISVQGNDWTSSIGFYDTAPIASDNIVYEVHGYPPPASSYTYTHIPVIIGEYGPASGGSTTWTTAFYADVETNQIPNLAWDFEPYSDCTPDLVNVTHDATMIQRTAWGDTVHAYLTAH